MKNFYHLFLLLFAVPLFSQSLIINEIITSNAAVITDDDGSYEDWVELYNGSQDTINLEGYGLTDNTNLFKWVFPAKIILPGEHLLVWCSEKNRRDSNAPLHTNFKISADGETITLTSSTGVLTDVYLPVIIPQNYSYGRSTDGAVTFAIFPEPTPGAANTTMGYTEILESPAFSVPSGFYDTSFQLNISTDIANATILYTLDGSEPDENNLNGTTYQYKNQYPQNPGQEFGSFLENTFKTLTYTGALTISDRSGEPNKIAAISTTYDYYPFYIPQFAIDKSVTVRAKLIKAGAMASKTVTQNYFMSPQANRLTLPVVALNIDEDKLYGYQNGIQVAGTDFDQWRVSAPNEESTFAPGNFARSGDEAEVKGNFSYYANGHEVINQDVGVRIQGGFSTRFPNKSYRLYARSEYGNGSFDYPFFAGNSYTSFERLILRNSGNDYGRTYFLDAFVHTAVKHLHFSVQSYQPTITYLNGEYWGLLNMRERYDKKYFERVFAIDENELDYIEINGIVSLKEGDLDHYNSLINFVENNSLANEDNYTYVTTQLDPENFADYYITETFINNTDWPSNNMELFRKKTRVYEPGAIYGQDGRWRWILKDTDLSLSPGGVYTNNTLSFITQENGTANNAPWATVLLRKMLENERFRDYFINRFADLLNTTFLPSRLEVIFNSLKQNIAAEMPSHISRWSAIFSMQTWDYNCESVLDYTNARPSYQRQHIREKFNITNNQDITLNVSDDTQGYIAINTIDINSQTPGVEEHPYPWTGVYFNNVPVTLKAVALPGYVFSHWSGDSNSTQAEISITPLANLSLTAHFIAATTIAVEEPLYYWMFDGNVTNDAPLTAMNATYAVTSQNAFVTYQSCLQGYPFTSTDANWRKASMERRNSPTALNYIPEANNNLAFADSNMKAIQIKQPFQSNGLENALVFTVPTLGYENIKFAFAAKDEGAANGVIIEYSTADGAPVWMTAGLSNSALALTANYQLFNFDFSDVAAADDKANFKIRVRFTGTNMTADDGNRLTFNNVSVSGTSFTAGVAYAKDVQVIVYPNPLADVLHIEGIVAAMHYKIFSYDGKLVSEGRLNNNEIDTSKLAQGIYMLQFSFDDKVIIKKIVKK